MSPEALAEVLHALGAPGAWADASGQVVVANEAFRSWAPSYVQARLDCKPDGAWLVAPTRTPLPVRAEPLGDGHLVLGASDSARVALDAVVTSVVRRLDRLGGALNFSLGAILRERPGEYVTASVHEAMTVVGELKNLRRQVLGLSPGVSQPTPQAVNLSILVNDALAAMTGPLPIEVAEGVADCVVSAVREKVFFGVAALVGTFARRVGGHGTILVDVRSRPTTGQVYFSAPGLSLEGMDLDAARDAVEAAGGRLLVLADQAVMEFPLFDSEAPRAPAEPRGTVLVVDDDPSTLAMMGAVLRRDGFVVMEADNGISGSTMLRIHGRALAALVTDAVLPGRSGIDLATEARRFLPRLPILIVTGHDEDLVIAKGLKVLRKPFTVAELRSAVTRSFQR